MSPRSSSNGILLERKEDKNCIESISTTNLFIKLRFLNLIVLIKVFKRLTLIKNHLKKLHKNQLLNLSVKKKARMLVIETDKLFLNAALLREVLILETFILQSRQRRYLLSKTTILPFTNTILQNIKKNTANGLQNKSLKSSLFSGGKEKDNIRS